MKFKITYQKNRKVCTKTIICHDYESLQFMEELPSNILKIKEIRNLNIRFSLFKNHKKEVLDFFTQLDIMLNANLTFSESIELLLESRQEEKIEQILQEIKKAITSSLSIEKALFKYERYLGKTAILFLKLGFENGNLKESIHSLVEILEEDINSTNSLNEVMRYPIILLASLCISIGMIFIYVLPNFEFIFDLLKDDIPLSTYILLMIKEILEKYTVLLMIILVVFIFGILYLIRRYKYTFDKIILLKIPLFSNMLQSYYFYRLFLSLSIIVKSKYQFQTAIVNSKNIVNNLYVQNVMQRITLQIKNGISISEAFKQSELFDSLTMKLLHIADSTNNYEGILTDITIQHKKRFHKSLKNFSSTIEPMLIFLISLIVLWLILAIMLPIWNLGAVIN